MLHKFGKFASNKLFFTLNQTFFQLEPNIFPPSTKHCPPHIVCVWMHLCFPLYCLCFRVSPAHIVCEFVFSCFLCSYCLRVCVSVFPLLILFVCLPKFIQLFADSPSLTDRSPDYMILSNFLSTSQNHTLSRIQNQNQKLVQCYLDFLIFDDFFLIIKSVCFSDYQKCSIFLDCEIFVFF